MLTLRLDAGADGARDEGGDAVGDPRVVPRVVASTAAHRLGGGGDFRVDVSEGLRALPAAATARGVEAARPHRKPAPHQVSDTHHNISRRGRVYQFC
jgi:hypothetical protein